MPALYAKSDEKHGVADTNRVTLTDAEREAIVFFVGFHNDGYGLIERHAATLRKLAERTK